MSSDCALPAWLPVLLSRHDVFEKILVLRCEAFREAKNLKAVAIADGPELDIGRVAGSAAHGIAIAIAIVLGLIFAFADNDPAHPVSDLVHGSIDARRPAPRCGKDPRPRGP